MRRRQHPTIDGGGCDAADGLSENPTAHEFVSTSQPPLVAGVPSGVGGAEARLIDSVAVGPTGSGAAGDGIVGRDGVLTTLARFVESGEPKVLLLDGDPGIGKTTLWEWTVRRAADSHRLLSARPLEVEAEMSFAAVADLLAGTAAELEAELPPPQWRALELTQRAGSARTPFGCCSPNALATGQVGFDRLSEAKSACHAVREGTPERPASTRATAVYRLDTRARHFGCIFRWVALRVRACGGSDRSGSAAASPRAVSLA